MTADAVQSHSRAPVLRVCDVSKIYETTGESVSALRDVSLTAHTGEFLAIMGSSGSGKSTLLHLLAGLDRPTSGTLWVEDRELASMGDRDRTLFRRRRLGIVFQAYNLLPTLTAVENVALPALLDGESTTSAVERASDLLAKMNLSGRLQHRPHAMSGGEQQRVAIARALINDPAVVLADEPTGNLDSRHGMDIWRLLTSLVRDQGRTVLAVTHEVDGAAFADRVIMLRDGGIVGEVKQHGSIDPTSLATRYRELAG